MEYNDVFSYYVRFASLLQQVVESGTPFFIYLAKTTALEKTFTLRYDYRKIEI